MGELTQRPAVLSDSGRAIAPDERAERLPDRPDSRLLRRPDASASK